MSINTPLTVYSSVCGKCNIIEIPNYVYYPTYIICGLYHLTNGRELFKFPIHLVTGHFIQTVSFSALLSYMLSFMNPLIGKFTLCGVYGLLLFNWYKKYALPPRYSCFN